MTEYTTSSQAFREFMSARERTAYWIQSVSPNEAELYSPSIPPSVLEGLVPSSPPSEADSSNSTPPRMVLRYNDGRPDIPIPRPNGLGRPGSKRHQESNVPRSHPLSYDHSNNRARSGSTNPSLLYHITDDLAGMISTPVRQKRYAFCLPMATAQFLPALHARATAGQNPFLELRKGFTSRSPNYLLSCLRRICKHNRPTIHLMEH